MRHNDGLRDIVAQIKSKCSELIARFKRIPMFNRVALLLGRLVQAIGVILMASGGKGVITELKRVRELNERIYTEWTAAQNRTESQQRAGGSFVSAFERIGPWSGEPEERQASITPSVPGPSYIEGKYFESVKKILYGLVSAFIGAVASEMANGNRVGDSRSTMMRLYKDSVSDLSSRIKTKFMEYIDYLKGVKYARPVIKMMLNVIRLAQEVSSPTDQSEYVMNIKRLYTAKKDLALSFIPEKLVGDGTGYRLAWLKSGRKIILGLTEALSGYVADSIIGRKINQEEFFEAYGREM